MTEPTPLTAEQIAEYDRRFEAGETLWFWCIHHGVRLELLTEPLSHRIDYINRAKPEHERATRLAWLQPVKQPERLPAEVVAAWEKCYAAWEKCYAAREKYDVAWEKCYAARKQYDAECKQYAAALKQYDAARKQYDAECKQYAAALKQYDAALKQYDAACKQCAADLSTLHREEYPGCPWVDGRLQFPVKETIHD